MLKAGVKGSGIYQMRHADLLDVTKALKVGVLYQVEYKTGWDGYKSINGIVYNLLLIQSLLYAAKIRYLPVNLC